MFLFSDLNCCCFCYWYDKEATIKAFPYNFLDWHESWEVSTYALLIFVGVCYVAGEATLFYVYIVHVCIYVLYMLRFDIRQKSQTPTPTDPKRTLISVFLSDFRYSFQIRNRTPLPNIKYLMTWDSQLGSKINLSQEVYTYIHTLS